MDVATVHRLVRDRRVAAHPVKYHAGKHGLSFHDCLVGLERCYAVGPDARPGKDGAWYALASHTYGRTLRVEFDAAADEDGNLILIVTAYHT